MSASSDRPVPPFELRPPTRGELPAVAILASRLVREHHAWDPQRFMLHEPLEPGYEQYLAGHLGDPGTVLIAAFAGERVAGYAFGTLEPRSWELLLDPCGGFHDLYVDAEFRGQGVARALVEALRERFRELGAPRVVLNTAWRNDAGRAFFERLGFRRTMVELTLELEG